MFRLALKNILFYKARSITTFLLTFVNATLFVVYVALMDGSHESMLYNAIKVYTGSAQIQMEGYREFGGNDYLLENEKELLQKLSTIEGLKYYSSRLETFALLSGDKESSGALLVGVNPEKERGLSMIEGSLKSGRYLKGDDRNAIYMGVELAKRIQVKAGDKIALIGSAIDGSFVAENFTVVGLFKTGMFEFDGSASFVNKAYLDQLMFSEGVASYIVIGAEHAYNLEALTQQIKPLLDKDTEFAPWTVLIETLVQAMEIDSFFGYISMSLFFLVIFFVIMIFSFINISGRVKELGLLQALGVTPKKMVRLLYLEMVIISLLSIVISAIVGGYISYYYEIHPIVIEGIAEAYKEYGIISDEIPMLFSWFTLSWNLLLIFMLNIIALLYPISYIKRFTPVEAMRHV